MEKQLIITVGREFGSGGHWIAVELSKRFHLNFYDDNLLEEVADKLNMKKSDLKEFDNVETESSFFTRNYRGSTTSINDHLANMQFDLLSDMAQAGESYVVVGRCAETILKNHPCVFTIFVLGDTDSKKERVMDVYNLTEKESLSMMKKMDRKRKMYHNYFCDGKWGDSRNYDISVNSSKLGLKHTVDMLEAMIRKWMEIS